MKTKDILNKKCTLLCSIDGMDPTGKYVQTTQTVYDLLITIPDILKGKIMQLRSLGYGSDRYKDRKKLFPNWIVSGTYPIRQINDNSTVEWSNIMSVDIDKSDNKDIDLNEIRKKIFELPYVFAVLKSISGEGLYALLLVEEGQYTKEYYKYIVDLWKNLFGITIDSQCNNISRKRFVGYDEEATKWIKSDDTEITAWKLKYIPPIEETKKKQTFITSTNNDDLVRKAIWKLLNHGYSIDNMNTTPTTRYGTWYHVACEFHHFNDGLDMFIKFSNNSVAYNDKQTDIIKKYNNAKIESDYDSVAQKWCGICKHIYGTQWWKDS